MPLRYPVALGVVMNLLPLIWKNARRNTRRTVLTISSIAVSMFLVPTLQAVLASLHHVGAQSGGSHLRLIVHRSTGITQPLPISYRAKIAALPGVKAVVGAQWFGGQYIDARNFFANFAVNPDQFEKVYDDYRVPAAQLEDWKRERTAALVGQKLMDTYRWKLGDRVTLLNSVFGINLDFVIRAVYTDAKDPSYEQTFYFNYDYLDEAMGGLNQVGNYVVKVDNEAGMQRVQDAIDAMFRNSAFETKTDTEQAYALGFVSMLGNINLLFAAISAAVIFAILFMVANATAMSVRERTAEVAIMKTLGFRRHAILTLIAGEAVLIALVGGLVGVLGAKLAYAFILATFDRARALGLAFGAASGLVTGLSVWSLVSGAATRAILRVTRFAVSVVGGLAGFGFGLIFYNAVGTMADNSGGLLADFGVPLETVAVCLVIATGVGVLSAAIPALRAARLSIAEALRAAG
jgi:putative ABC transport system permease protein